MHRQSLGSPSLKLQHGGIILLKDDTSSSTSPSNEALSPGGGRAVEEEKLKKLKPKPKTTTTEIYIHFIPMLTLLCLLVLYLSSHNPSQIDLAEFNGHKNLAIPGDSIEDIQKSHQIVEMKQGEGGTLAVSWKNRRFLRRKMADF
ncbi:uncharacterized protein [Henckelia pumila]|uniref:uncharacterized protein n=1 Tax=Henckelia pumila TaxID=405737 RepID=UPI003C6DDBBF